MATSKKRTVKKANGKIKEQGDGKKQPALKKQPMLLQEAVRRVGSEALVAEALGCSQQSVSAWMHGTNAPRPQMQAKLNKLYSIPEPW